MTFYNSYAEEKRGVYGARGKETRYFEEVEVPVRVCRAIHLLSLTERRKGKKGIWTGKRDGSTRSGRGMISIFLGCIGFY